MTCQEVLTLIPFSSQVAPPPKDIQDLEKYYAVFLPKNLSDERAKDVESKVSSIPTLLGRSASTESLHKDRYNARIY